MDGQLALDEGGMVGHCQTTGGGNANNGRWSGPNEFLCDAKLPSMDLHEPLSTDGLFAQVKEPHFSAENDEPEQPATGWKWGVAVGKRWFYTNGAAANRAMIRRAFRCSRRDHHCHAPVGRHFDYTGAIPALIVD